jgi:hypothetical protein
MNLSGPNSGRWDFVANGVKTDVGPSRREDFGYCFGG